MDLFEKVRNEKLAQIVIKGLKSRNMTGYYVKDRDEALKKALELIPEGSRVAMGGCMSAQEIGLTDALNNGHYTFYDRAFMAKREGLIEAYGADVFVSSVNALTDDGILVNIDGNANRVSFIA